MHTPGPWLRDGRLVYALQDCAWLGWPSKENRFQASFSGKAPEDELEANAALAAAAPELLAALKRIEDYDIDWSLGTAENIRKVQQIALAAIAKAEGEA